MLPLPCCSLAGSIAQAKELCGRLGGLDVLVNNAGVTIRETEASLNDRLRVMNVNFLGAVKVVDALLPCVRSEGCVVKCAPLATSLPGPLSRVRSQRNKQAGNDG